MEGTSIRLGDVELWYAEHGDQDAPPLVMLHPGGVDARAFAPNLEALGTHFHLYLPERRAHGHVRDTGSLSFRTDAADTAGFIEKVVGGPVRLLGCSDGAIVGLLLAATRPDLVDRFAMISGPFHWSGWDAGVLDELYEPPPAFLRDGYAEVSPEGAAHYDVLAGKLAALHRHEPDLEVTDLAAVGVRTLVMLGDDDEVTLEHAAAALRALPEAELAVVPGTSHALLWEKPALCAAILLDFLRHDAVQTFAARRRR